MSTIASTTSTAASAAASSTTSTATTSATSTENEFLTLLTTELTNQDPLNAMDASTFTSQLVSYAGLEQQINTNSKLDGITSLLTTLTASS